MALSLSLAPQAMAQLSYPLPANCAISTRSQKIVTPFTSVAQISAKESIFGQSLWLRASPTSRQPRRLHSGKTPLKVVARGGGAREIEVEVEKPLGITLKEKSGGGVQVASVASGGNAARAGIKSGDQVVYTSSFFGDELWPADKLGFTKTAVQACPNSVFFVLARGGDVDVKRLPKRPLPPRFGRKLTDAQKERATHICLDCGYVYTLSKPFESQPDEFECPQCSAPKKRFAKYNAETGRAEGGGTPVAVVIGGLAGVAAIAALLIYGAQ